MTNGSGPHPKRGKKHSSQQSGTGKAKKKTTTDLARKTLADGVKRPPRQRGTESQSSGND